MAKMRRLFSATALLLCMIVVITACGSTLTNPTTGSTTSSTKATSQETEKEVPKEIIKINFYGKIVEFTSGEPMIQALQEELKDQYEINAIQVDWGNLDTVIKTGIASGEPNDIYAKQGQYLKPYVDANQAMDLTSYLEENDGEWAKTFNPGTLDLGKYNGKYYGLPLNTNTSAIFINEDIFSKAGVAVPEKWTWDEFTNACEQIKTKTGVFPFAIFGSLNNFFPRNGVLSLGKQQNKLEDLANGKVSAMDPIFETVMKNTKDLYDKKYWYPGEGAMTITRDEATAAFAQGKVAMLGEVTAVASTIVKGSNFKVSMVRWPSMGPDSVVLGGADGFFIPVNAPHKEDAVKVLKVFLGTKIQQIHADAGYAAVNANVTVNDPVIKKAMILSSDIYPQEFFGMSQKMSDYWSIMLVPGYVLQKDNSKILTDMEQVRQDSLNK